MNSRLDFDDDRLSPRGLAKFEERGRALSRARITSVEVGSETDTDVDHPVQLPIWQEPVRAVPNGFLRSALFGAIRKGHRRYLKGEKIAALSGIEIRYTGERLDQGDLETWEAVLHAVRHQKLGSLCRVTSYSLLKFAGKSDSGKNRATLKDRITRLRANALEIKQGRYSYIGGLLSRASKDEETQEWLIELDVKLCPLFATDQYTKINWEVRHALQGQQLAQWLLGFYASHETPFPIKVRTLHKLSGSQTARVDHFRDQLRKSLQAVADASARHQESFSFEIRGDLVHVKRKHGRRGRFRSSTG